ncbi:MAG: ABC transporter permease [Actinobacteria bacterium]|nr:ABC transporter permease [Actinomycetota bacterium]
MSGTGQQAASAEDPGTADEADDRRAPAERTTITEYARSWWQGVRAGDLGSLPIVVGLILITIIFTTLNERFLSAVNFVNLITQMSPLAIIAIGIVFVLVIAEVDLSVGYLSGVAAVLLARFLGEEAWPVYAAVPAVLAFGAFVGFIQGWLVAKIGLPSLIVTLGGLVGLNGLVLILIGGRGTIVIQNDIIIAIANPYLPDLVSYAIVVLSAGGLLAVQLRRRRRRLEAGLSATPLSIIGIRIGALLAIGLAAVTFAARSRGIPVVGLILLVLLVVFSIVLGRTGFGRHVYAVGGNPEAARRAGIDVDRVRIACFMISATMAALGGIVFASRLRSVDTGAGGGQIELNAIAAAVIGGTSLFGGRGRISSALLGALVIMGVDNGMGLLGLSSGAKFVVTAVVLLAAVVVDSVARRGRTRSGVA